MKFLKVLAAAVMLAAASARAQVLQNGTVTAGHPTYWVYNNIVGDGGAATSGNLTGVGVTASSLTGICQNSHPITSPYAELCIGITDAAAQISVQGYGESTPPFSIVVNGTSTIFPISLSNSDGSITLTPNPFLGSGTIALNQAANFTFTGTDIFSNTLQIPGAAPGTPANGDIWTTSAGLFARINGGTVGPYAASNAFNLLTGGATYSIAASGGNYTTIQAALTAIDTNAVAPGGNYNLTLQCAHTFVSASPITIASRFADALQFTGCASTSASVTSVVSSSGSAGAYSIVLQLNAAGGITANNDYVVIYGASGGSNPTYLNGAFPVTNVNSGANQITITSPSNAAVAPSGAVTASVKDISSVLSFTSVDGLRVWNGGTALQLQDVAVVCTGTPGNGLSIQDVGRLFISGGAVAVYGCADGLLGYYNSETNAQTGSILGIGAATSNGIALQFGSVADLRTLNVVGSAGIGIYLNNATVNVDSGGTSGNTGDGFQANLGSSAFVGGPGGAFYSTGNGGYGFNAPSFSNIQMFSGITVANNTSANYNTAYVIKRGIDAGSIGIGFNSLSASTVSSNAFDTCVGGQTCQYQTSATGTTALGYQACQGVSGTPLTGNSDTCIGAQAGNEVQGGSGSDTLIGYQAGFYITTAGVTTAVGYQSCQGLTGTPLTGAGNTCVGYQSGTVLQGAATADTALGRQSCGTVTTGANDLCLGYQVANTTLATGSRDILIGTSSSCDTASASTNDTFLLCASSGATQLLSGNLVSGSLSLTDNGTFLLPNIATDATHTDATVCEDTTTHQFYFGSGASGVCLGTSSRRFKHDIAPLREGLSAILALRPKTFFYKPGYGDGGKRQQYGLIAEDVVRVLPTLTGLDASGKPNSVDLVGLVPVLVKAVQQQQHEIAALTRKVSYLEHHR